MARFDNRVNSRKFVDGVSDTIDMHQTITYFTDSDINREHSNKDSKAKDERKWRLNDEFEMMTCSVCKKIFNLDFVKINASVIENWNLFNMNMRAGIT